MTDSALAAVARHLRGVIHGADPEVAAREILAILRGHGWRPTNTVQLPPPPSAPLPPERVAELAARVRGNLTGGTT